MTTASFRDPAGRVFLYRDKVFRAVNATGVDDFRAALSSNVLRQFVDTGRLVGASVLDRPQSVAFLDEVRATVEIGDDFAFVAEHERLPFQNYPYCWTPEMLHAAAGLTLDLQERLLEEGFGLKDATPYNVIFRGPQPVFVDWLSFERRDARDPVWLAQAQFIRTFVLPLLVNRHFGVPLAQIFLASRDGLEPEAVARMCGGLRRFRPPFFSLVTLPAMLGARRPSTGAIYEKHLSDDPEKARFILAQQLKHLRRLLVKVAPDPARTSDWAEYTGPKQHFTDRYLETKDQFLTAALDAVKPRRVLDVGCNTGYFSRIAARAGASVLAIDLDPTAVGRVWRMAAADRLDILPLVVDLARPTPGTGWRNRENAPFVERIRGKMDAVVMLAVIHHLLVTERVPLAEILALVAETTRDAAVVEFVPPGDPMFRQIARGRDHLYEYLTREHFEAACAKHFRIERAEPLADSDRRLYLLRK